MVGLRRPVERDRRAACCPQALDGYAEAARRIEAVAGSGRPRLYLGGLGLTEPPPELFEQTHLNDLNLWSNQLSALPAWLGNLSKLQMGAITVSGNPLKFPPPAIVARGHLAILAFLRRPVAYPPYAPSWTVAAWALSLVVLARLWGKKAAICDLQESKDGNAVVVART